MIGLAKGVKQQIISALRSPTIGPETGISPQELGARVRPAGFGHRQPNGPANDGDHPEWLKRLTVKRIAFVFRGLTGMGQAARTQDRGSLHLSVTCSKGTDYIRRRRSSVRPPTKSRANDVGSGMIANPPKPAPLITSESNSPINV